MFIILLRFTALKEKAAAFMDGHKTWLQLGFDDGVFLVSGSLKPSAGGAVVAVGLSREEVEARVQADPFVSEGIVAPEIIEIDPSRVAAPLEGVLK